MPNLAGHGLSTGLPDRLLLYDRLSQALAQCRRCNGLLGLIRIDLEGLERSVVLGEPGRARLLQEIAARLRTQLRASDTVARIENDGFALILPDLSDQGAAGMVASKIVTTLENGSRSTATPCGHGRASGSWWFSQRATVLTSCCRTPPPPPPTPRRRAPACIGWPK
jgi:GGDEF domain-containing protein